MDELEMDMPTPCQKCGKIFDLNDGRGSEKWFPNTTICEDCAEAEQEEIEEDDLLHDANIQLSDALFTFKNRGAGYISEYNRALIMQLVEKRCDHEKGED